MSRSYGVFSRNKLPRNKYGIIYDESTINNSSSVFGSTEGALSVGDTLVSISDFRGASDIDDGTSGLVPAPLAGQQDYFLKGTGDWMDIPAYRWLQEFPSGAGLEKSGLSIDGNFNVGKTLSTMDLKVEGAAHFWSLIIDEVKANGGQVIISPSMFTVDFIDDIQYYSLFDETSSLKTLITIRKDMDKMLRACGVVDVKCRRVWERNDDGTKSTSNECQVGDMLRCKSFNIKPGVYDNVSNTDYWTFVCGVGDGVYVDADGVERSGYWIDLAYSLRLANGHNLPLGTVLKEDGTFIIPEGYSEITNALELKKVSNQVLTGSDDVEPEIYDSEEFIDIQNKVLKIRGLDANLNSLLGVESSDSLEDNEDNLSQVAQQLEYIANGTVTDNADPDDVASLILTGTYSDTPDSGLTQSEETEASDIVGQTISNTFEDVDAEYGLKIDKIGRHSLVLKEGTTLGKNFIAADDLYNNLGVKVYDKGDIVPENTTITGDWRLVDTIGSETVLAVDGSSEFVPEDIEEINNGTDDTESGKNRNPNQFIEKDYSSATEWTFGYGVFSCRVGDTLACLGHLFDVNRSNAIVLTSNDPIDPELEAPCMAQYNSIDTFGESISNYRMTAIAANGNEFIGSFLINYGGTFVDVNERINLFINDINTGLENVGIHLDGENSKITLVGSVDIKQHSNSSYDSISVYDNLDTKRVEILPFDIPRRNSPESSINITNANFGYITTSKTATKSYITYDKWKHWWFWPFNYDWEYKYILHDYTVSLSSSLNLGSLRAGSSLDLSALNLHIWAKTFLVGKTEIKNHGTGKQSVSVLNYTLKKDGVAVSGQTRVSLLNNPSIPTPSISGLNSADINISLSGTFLDDWTVPSDGSYSLEINVTYIVYAYTTSYSGYSNYYYTVDCGLSGGVKSSVSRVSVGNDDTSGKKMTIGTNGLYFSLNNSRHVYAADDGFELLWDNAGVRIDSTYGLRETKFYQTISSSTYLTCKNDIVIANYSSGGYNCYLPNALEYGNGRKITILAFQGLKVRTTNSQSIRVNTASSHLDSSTLEFGSGASGSLVIPKYVAELVAIDGIWYIVSYY